MTRYSLAGGRCLDVAQMRLFGIFGSPWYEELQRAVSKWCMGCRTGGTADPPDRCGGDSNVGLGSWAFPSQ